MTEAGTPTGPGSRRTWSDAFVERTVERVRSRLARGRAVCVRLPGEGRLHFDRRLPFLVVHRRPPERDDPGTDELVTAFAAHLLTDGMRREGRGLGRLVRALLDGAAGALGAALVVEVWTTSAAERGEGPPVDDGRKAEDAPPPRATLHVTDAVPAEVADELVDALRAVRMCPENGGELGVRPQLDVALTRSGPVAPPGLPPLLGVHDRGDIHLVGVELSPFFRDPRTARPHPRVVQALRRGMGRALEDAFFQFSLDHTSLDAPHPRALGRRSLGRAALHVDRRLGEVFGAFDSLLQVTPVNAEEAWTEFRASGCTEPPALRYRPLPFDPEHLKRRLFDVPIERVEDPLLNHLFREKQEELDREITLLRELGTPRFLPASVQLHGRADDDLVAMADAILERLPSPDRGGDPEEYAPDGPGSPGYVEARAFAQRAREEIEAYRREEPRFTAGVEIRDDVTAGLMVSRGVLRVSDALCVPSERVDALIQHEVGTHAVTYFNGTQQPLRIFASGLAGYEPLQEGLAVLAEHLVGGLSGPRMRILAARVLAVRALLDGAGFLETFRLLRGRGFERRSAFIVTLRVFRGGGFTKDAAYLRGLRDLLVYLDDGGPLEPLFVGKLGLSHTGAVQELVLRGVLRLPTVRPRYAREPAAMERLEGCRRLDVMDLVDAVGPVPSAAPRSA